ncbi:SAM-DEPENDENT METHYLTRANSFERASE [Salix purpurea]|uniref:Methyltransferase n=1 Tax=Salix purpurea TaxID=77065 RepID=A0A9Q0WVB0_SALPP|nr:SAM-DEPENDENT METHYLTRANSFERASE [Salix purpurea]
MILSEQHKAKGTGLAPWPARLITPPPRLADFGYSAEMFEKDTKVWQHRVENYWNLLSPKIQCESYSIYPRTYDLLHAWTVFSDILKKDCSAEDLLIEMDRILRPTGLHYHPRQAISGGIHKETYDSTALGSSSYR